MAKKNDVFQYGSSSIPSAENKYSVMRWAWSGLNRSNKIDTGAITDCAGILVDTPNLVPALIPHHFMSYSEPISIHGFGDRLFAVYRDGGKIKVDCILKSGARYTGALGDAKGTREDFLPRSMVQFNVASNLENIIEAEYVRKILIYPDRYSIDFEITGNFEPKSLGNTYPSLALAAVYGSRVFGVDDNLVYASAYNDYADWDLDTADEYSDANAWVSMSQANVKADGAFTAIASYDNHIVLFKRDFMQLVYHNKNPFRIVDVGSFGCDNAYGTAESEGVLYFASSDGVYAFTGGNPKKISSDLDIDSFRGAVMGAWNDRVYLYADGNLYCLCDGMWSCLGSPVSRIRQFASCDYGIAALCEDGSIIFVDWLRDGDGAMGWEEEYGNPDGGDWWFETDFIALQRLDVRRIKKVSVLCEAEEGASVAVYLLRDDEVFDKDKSMRVGETEGHGMVLLRVLTRMTSGYMHRLRFVGRGKVKIYAMELKLSWGGDVYVEG